MTVSTLLRRFRNEFGTVEKDIDNDGTYFLYCSESFKRQATALINKCKAVRITDRATSNGTHCYVVSKVQE